MDVCVCFWGGEEGSSFVLSVKGVCGHRRPHGTTTAHSLHTQIYLPPNQRYNPGRQELTLTTARFLSRAHNKQYLIYLLENLVAEAKKEKAGGSAAA